ncbi:hypothetical protein FAUST_4064 [Fusarium austroamericanum]|uniref:Chromo domain-containing protein n=1 Tax=Fusarium austroamericanum TaxID=282268 RepID=A0AAN6C3K5_FUSAU|nr:hypothetical protein FAUST_4064 [Fusarium austroamericanum]
MNALFGFLSSPLKKQPERPSSDTMPVPASQSRTLSPRDHRISRRASDRFSESETRSPRSRLSNVPSPSSVHDTTADISITSTRRETISTMPPPSKTPQRRSMGNTQSSPAPNRSTMSRRVASSPRERPSPRRQPSVELGEDSIISGYNDTNHSPAMSNRASAKNSPAQSVRSRRSSAKNSPATSSARKHATMKPNFTAVNDGPSERSSPRNQPRSRRSQVVVEEEEEKEEKEVFSGEENGVEEEEVFSGEGQEVEDKQSDQEALEQEEPEQEESEEVEEEDDQEHQFKRIMDYRWVDDKIELRVEWSDGERTWSDEEIFHQDSPEALFDFWRHQPGGRPENPNDPGVYLVFAIRKHRTFRGKKQVLVEWLGYDSSEQTWENQSYIEQVAKEHVDDYMSKLQGTDTDKAKPKTNTKATSTSNGPLSKKKGIAKPVARGRGRPPKAATKPTTQKTQGRTRVTKR